MTRNEHLMTIAIEGCNEIAQRISKALRFGVYEIQPGQPLTNVERISEEIADLRGVLDMLGIDDDSPWVHTRAEARQRKVEEFLRYSAECGTPDVGGGSARRPPGPTTSRNERLSGGARGKIRLLAG